MPARRGATSFEQAGLPRKTTHRRPTTTPRLIAAAVFSIRFRTTPLAHYFVICAQSWHNKRAVVAALAAAAALQSQSANGASKNSFLRGGFEGGFAIPPAPAPPTSGAAGAADARRADGIAVLPRRTAEACGATRHSSNRKASYFTAPRRPLHGWQCVVARLCTTTVTTRSEPHTRGRRPPPPRRRQQWRRHRSDHGVTRPPGVIAYETCPQAHAAAMARFFSYRGRRRRGRPKRGPQRRRRRGGRGRHMRLAREGAVQTRPVRDGLAVPVVAVTWGTRGEESRPS